MTDPSSAPHPLLPAKAGTLNAWTPASAGVSGPFIGQ